VSSPKDLGTIEQVVEASAFRGKRIKYTGHLRTEGAKAGAGAIWFRAENANGAVLAFQSTEGRSISSGDRWPEHSIVIDVPSQATVVLFGAFLVGPGSLWLDDLHVVAVDRSTPLTGEVYPPGVTINPPPNASRVLPAPANLDFEEQEVSEPVDR
jgi:hypothetical protein